MRACSDSIDTVLLISDVFVLRVELLAAKGYAIVKFALFFTGGETIP
jgi:hypothetical protein